MMVALAFAVALQSEPTRAAPDGFLTREEAARATNVAVANAILGHCQLDRGATFRALTAHHRHGCGRSETEMGRITVGHGM